MKLLAFVLVLSYAIAYTIAVKRGQYWPTNTKIFTTPHRFRREIDSQDSIIENLNTLELSFDDDENPRFVLFDNEPDTAVNFGGDDVVFESESQSNAQLHSMYLTDENNYLGIYTFYPGAYGGFAQNFGIGGGFRWRRNVEPRSHFEAETQRSNGFITGFVELQRGANSHRVEPTIGANRWHPFQARSRSN